MANQKNRKQKWRQATARQFEDRDVLNSLWQQLVDLRQKQASNAGFESYLAYRCSC